MGGRVGDRRFTVRGERREDSMQGGEVSVGKSA